MLSVQRYRWLYISLLWNQLSYSMELERLLVRQVSLGGEAIRGTEIGNPPQQNLQHPVRHARRILGKLMSSQLRLVESETALRTPVSSLAPSSHRSLVVLRMRWNPELLARVVLEALLAIPSHILDLKQSAIRRDDHIEVAVPDEDIVGILDHALQHPTFGWALAEITQRSKYPNVTLLPVYVQRSVQRLLDVCAIEVDDFAGGACNLLG